MTLELPTKWQNSVYCGPAIFAFAQKCKGVLLDSHLATKDDIPAVFYKHYPAFANGSMNLTEFAWICGLSRQTVYKYLKLIE